jgi:hypothetical protein
MTVGGARDAVARVIAAFRRGGGEGKPVYVQHALSWAPTESDARRGAHEQWRFSVLGPEVLPILRTPAQFSAAAATVTADDVAAKIRVSPTSSATPGGSASTWRWASTRCTCSTSARTSARTSTRSARACCRRRRGRLTRRRARRDAKGAGDDSSPAPFARPAPHAA